MIQEWFRDNEGDLNFGPSFAGYPVTQVEIDWFNSELAAGRGLKLRSGTVLYDNLYRLWALDESGPTRQFVRRPTNAEIAAMGFSGQWADLLGKPAFKLEQSAKIDTLADGTFTWTYPTAFGAGVVPNIQVTPQDTTAGIAIQHKIGMPTNTSVSGRVDRIADLVVVGIHVVGFTTSAVTRIHIRAIEP